MKMDFEIGFMIKRLQERLRMNADLEFGRMGLTFSQVQVLGYLKHCGGSAMQREIEKHLDVSHPTVVGIVNRMEKNGFVICRSDETDRRQKIVTLTEKSVQTDALLEAGRARQEEKLLTGFSYEETELLRGMLNRLLKNSES